MGKKEKQKHDLEYFIGFGWYQIYHYFLQSFKYISSTTNISLMVFAGAFPKLICDPAESSGISKNQALMMDSKDICKLWKNNSCANFTKDIDFNSIANEWDLICDKAGLVYLTMSIQMVGILIGAPTFGQLSDLFGRKKIAIFTTCCATICGGTSALSPNVQVFTAFRFLIGFFLGGQMTCTYVFLIEFIKQKHRLIIMALGGWPIATMLFALMGYLFSDWRKLTVAGNCLGIPVIVMLCFAKESPKWLLQRGRTDDAKKIFLELARWNRRKINLTELNEVLEAEKEKFLKRRTSKPSFWHLFYTRKFVRYTAALSLAWFTVSCVGYGLFFNMEKLSGNRYLNILFSAFIDFVIATAMVLAEVFIKKCGRKAFHLTGGGFIALACLATFILFATGSDKTEATAVRILCLVAACITGIPWTIVYLIAAEVYPTPIRNVANSFCSISARIGGILAPQILYLGHAWSPGPFLIFALLMGFNITIFQCLLPETKGKPLPDQMPNKTERIWKTKKNKREMEANVPLT